MKKYDPDGRKVDEIRPLESEVGLLPRLMGQVYLLVVRHKHFQF